MKEQTYGPFAAYPVLTNGHWKRTCKHTIRQSNPNLFLKPFHLHSSKAGSLWHNTIVKIRIRPNTGDHDDGHFKCWSNGASTAQPAQVQNLIVRPPALYQPAPTNRLSRAVEQSAKQTLLELDHSNTHMSNSSF